MKSHVRNILVNREQDVDHLKTVAHPTVFHDILDSNLPADEKTVERLWQDAQVIMAAGTETTAWTLSVITYYLLTNPDIRGKLREELIATIPDSSMQATIKQLEQLPYLVRIFSDHVESFIQYRSMPFQTAVIQEGLRLSFGVSTRLQRVASTEVLTFNDGKAD
jgi:cytochrome P450